MERRGCNRADAERLLADADGFVRRALAGDPGGGPGASG
jgi:hypothetical protein